MAPQGPMRPGTGAEDHRAFGETCQVQGPIRHVSQQKASQRNEINKQTHQRKNK